MLFRSGRAGSEAIRPVIPLPELSVLPAGTPPPNASDLLARPPFARLLHEAAGRFDCVLVDTPAAYECADAQTISSHARGALIVTRRNFSRSAALSCLTTSAAVAAAFGSSACRMSRLISRAKGGYLISCR